MSKVIAVTGGSGYVGSRVVKVLLEKGYEVISIDSVSPQDRPGNPKSNTTFRKCNLKVPEEAMIAFKGVDVVLHLAADIGSLSYMENHQADIITNNSQIDASVYPALVKNSVSHILYSSSSMVYQHPPRYPYTEKDISNINPPSNVYGFSKLSGEYFCRAFQSQYGLNYTILRYHNIYGPGEDSKGATPGDIHVIPALLEKVLIMKQYPIEIIGDPASTRPFTYVDDAVDVTATLVEAAVKGEDKIKQQDYNIGCDTYYSIEQLAQIIWNQFGDKRAFSYVEVPKIGNTAIRREVDVSKLRADFNWSTKIELENGLKEVAKWIEGRNTNQ